jgi:hypothetical protein
VHTHFLEGVVVVRQSLVDTAERELKGVGGIGTVPLATTVS